MTLRRIPAIPMAAVLAACGAALLHPAPGQAQTTLEANAQQQAPQSLVLLFGTGSTRIRPQDEALLDTASRLYREAHPIVMVLTGGTDTVGSPEKNLVISQQRADAVLRGLVARGIPAGRFQILAKGESEPAVPTAQGVAEAQNRRVEIRWR